MSTANTLFVMVASVLVFFMTPGLAFFYGGMVARRNTVNTLLSVFYICGLAIILWVAVGYSLSFSGNVAGLVGNLRAVMFNHVPLDQLTATKIPLGIYALFQMMFAIITPALFVGAIVGRVRFKFLTWFIICWSILVYYPLVHLVWGGGILGKLGALDFAGGTVVHINAGVTALALSLWVGPRHDLNDEPANRSWVLLGTAILWIGWYGFNAGSALAIDDVAVQAMLTTTVATAAAMVAWQLLESWQTKHTTLVGTCTGALCGLVAITPAAGYVSINAALWIGIIATVCSFYFITAIKPYLHSLDDTLDAFGCHGISGIWGSIATGLFASHHINPQVVSDGLLVGGGWHLFSIQLLATAVTIVIAFAFSTIIIKALGTFMTIRVSENAEAKGLDLSEHGETIGTLGIR
ncbi:ammonium transporter [Limosilactobacillus pontis]|uniref:ammonium transporter n=1 Tax=Limosilactobacillus pontis TaxID=35787 RepID=UPI001D3D8BF0|nr:ammonium transporter [Limosilactobacillus pontis]HJE26965.1 ammonium transporter [Limosilactobacillus pontis]